MYPNLQILHFFNREEYKNGKIRVYYGSAG